jgi:hypothetical protein
METLQHLINLFSTADQVIIPDVGCFYISRHEFNHDKGAGIIIPSQISVLFNPYLLTNDGVLERHIAKEKNISKEAAKYELEKLAIGIKQELSRKGEVFIPRVGKLKSDSLGKISFQQEEFTVVNNESFGLTSVPAKVHPQDRSLMATEQKIKQGEPKEENGVLKWLFISLAIIIIVSLIFLLAFQYFYNSIKL